MGTKSFQGIRTAENGNFIDEDVCGHGSLKNQLV
jgi:hypothetical protein